MLTVECRCRRTAPATTQMFQHPRSTHQVEPDASRRTSRCLTVVDAQRHASACRHTIPLHLGEQSNGGPHHRATYVIGQVRSDGSDTRKPPSNARHQRAATYRQCKAMPPPTDFHHTRDSIYAALSLSISRSSIYRRRHPQRMPSTITDVGNATLSRPAVSHHAGNHHG